MSDFDPTKPITTVGGWPAELLRTLSDGRLVALHQPPSEPEIAVTHDADGAVGAESGLGEDFDLINLTTKTTQVKVYLTASGEAFTEGQVRPAGEIFGVYGTLTLASDGKTVTASLGAP